MPKSVRRFLASFLVISLIGAYAGPSVYPASRAKEKVNAIFKQGKVFYDQGKYKEALDVWNSLDEELLSQEPSVQKVIEFLKGKIPSDYEEQEAASAPSAPTVSSVTVPVETSAEAASIAPIKTPSAVSQSLNDSTKNLQSQISQAKAQKGQNAKKSAEAEAALLADFQKGKDLFDQGNGREALAVWRGLLPKVANPGELEKQLKKIESSLNDLDAARAEAAKFSAVGGQKFQAPGGFVALLEGVSEDLDNVQSQIAQAKIQKEQDAKKSAEEALVAEFQKGKVLFDKGNARDALAIWKALLPKVKNSGELEKQLIKIESSLDDLDAARAASAKFSAAGGQKFQAPGGFVTLLQGVSEYLDKEAREVEWTRWKSDEKVLDRQKWIKENYEKAHDLFSREKYKEAIDMYALILPYLEDGENIEPFLQSVRMSYQNLLDAQKASEQIEQNAPKKFKAPVELVTYLSKAETELQSQAKIALEQKQKLEKAGLDQQVLMNTNFEKGKALYEKGRIKEAVAAWSSVTPYLEEGARVQGYLESISKNYEAARITDEFVQGASLKIGKKFKAPDGFILNLKEASEALEKEAQQAAMLKWKTQNELMDQEKWFKETLAQAKAHFDEGRVEKGLETSRQVLPMLEESAQIQAFLDGIALSEQNLQDAKKTSAQFAQSRNKKFKAPDALIAMLSDADQRLQFQAKQAMTQKAVVDKAALDQQVWVNSAFEKGKAFYQQGKVREAISAWTTITPYLEGGTDIQSSLDLVQKNYESAQASAQLAKDAVSQKDQKYKSPAELPVIMEQMNAKLQTDLLESKAQKARTEQAVAERQKWILSTFQKGKDFFASGHTQDAITEWDRLTPYLEEASEIRALIEKAKLSYQSLVLAQSETARFASTEYKSLKVPYAADIQASLAQSLSSLETQTQIALEQKSQLEKTISDRKVWIDQTFLKGKALYEKGQFKEAAQTWSALVPYLDSSAQIRVAIDAVLNHADQAVVVKTQAEEAISKKDQAFKAPDELAKMLLLAKQSLKTEAFQAQTQKAQLDQTLFERQQWINQNFQKGKDLYGKQKYTEALSAWKEILPYLENKDEVKSYIESVEASIENAKDAKNAADQAQSRVQSKVKAPQELIKSLSDLSQKHKLEIQESLSARSKFEQDSENREKFVTDTFQKGKDLYNQGSYLEAISTWKSILPYLEESSQAQAYLQSVQASLENAQEAKRAADAAKMEIDRKFQAPGELLLYLNQAGQKLSEEAKLSNGLRVKAEQNVSDRRDWLVSTFQKGRALVEQGKVQEGLQVFNQLIPYLNEEKEVAQAIKAIEKNYNDASAAKAALTQTQEKSNQKFKAPAELTALLSQANLRFQTEIADALSRKKQSEDSLSQKQLWILTAFQKGKELYTQGKIGEAVESWGEMTPYLDPQSDAQKLIDQSKESQRAALEARRSAVAAAAKEYQGFQIPADLVTYLDDADQKLRNEAQSLSAQKLRADKTFFDKQAWINASFEKGLAFYQNGKIPEALDAWDNLIPYLESEPLLKKELVSLRSEYAAILQIQKEVEAQKGQKLQAPAELKMALADFTGQLKLKTQAYQNDKSALEKSLLDRQAAVNDSLQKAKQLFKDEKPAEAVALLEDIVPNFDADSGIAAQVAGLRASQKNLLAAQAVAQQALQKKDQKLKAPDGFLKAIAGFDQALQNKTKESLSVQAQLQSDMADRQKLVEMTFLKGQTAFNEGKIREALESWTSLTAYLEKDSEAAVMIDQVQTRYKNLLDAQFQAQAAAVKKDQKFQLSPAWLKSIASAQSGLEAQTKEVIGQRLAMEKSVSNRHAWIQTTFESGNANYQNGDYDKALAEWQKLTPYVDESSGFEELLAQTKASLANFQAAKTQTANFASTQYKSLKVPYAGEMNATLSKVLADLDRETQSAVGQKAQMEKTLSERKAWVDQNFQKGKELFQKGQIKDAAVTWTALIPYLESEQQIKALLDALLKNYEFATQAQSQAKEVLSRKDQKLKAPEELAKLLTDGRELLKSQVFDAQSQKAQAEQAAADRSEWVSLTFLKGRDLYKQQKIQEALETWKQIIPYLENADQFQGFIQAAEDSYRAAEEAKKLAAESASLQELKLKSPPEFVVSLTEINNQLKYQLYDAKTRKDKADKSLQDRQSLVSATFEKGSVLFAQEKYYEALIVWRELLPYLDEQTKLQPLLDQAFKNYQAQVEAANQAKTAAARQGMKFQSPENLGRYLSDISENYAKQTQSFLKEREQMSATVVERQSWVNDIFQKGKNFYDAGQYDQAVSQWKLIVPLVNEGDQVAKYIEVVDANLQNLKSAQNSSQSAVVERDKRFAVPQGLPELLGQAAKHLKDEAFEAENQRVKADQTLSERQLFVKTTFEKGKTLYGEAHFAEAIQEWEKLGPYLDEQTGIQKLIGEAKTNYKNAMDSKQLAVEAFAKEYKGLKLSYTDQMIKLLEEANAKLSSESAQNKLKVDDLEKTLAERREWAANTFNKASVYYDQGRYDEAIEQWERLLPYLESDSPMKKQIEMIRTNFNALQNGSKSAETLNTKKDKWTEVPEEFSQSLTEVSKKFEEKARDAQSGSATLEKEISDRKEYFRFVYQKGKDLFDQGNDEEALKAWETLMPYLAEAPGIKAQIETAKNSLKDLKAARKLQEQIDAKKKSLLPLPPVEVQAQAQPVQSEAPAPAEDPAEPAKPEAASGAKTEFVSGEIVDVDSEKQFITIKLYTVGDKKTLELHFDQNTLVKGDEKGKSIGSLQAGTAVDLRYDPDSKQAVTVYVY